MEPTLPGNIPLNVTREWVDVSGDLGLRFTLENSGDEDIEIGSLGFPTECNSIFTNRSAVEIQEKCSLEDPYIGLDAGYLQITPVRGTGTALVITPLGDTPLEAYRNLPEVSYPGTEYGSQTFEGFYEWQVLTKAWAENEWSDAQPWNPPSSRTLKPGESMTVGLRFSLSRGGVRDIATTVQNTETPFAVGVPGYIVPSDLTAQLFLFSQSDASNITCEPSGAFSISKTKQGVYTLQLSPSAWGRARVTIKYLDGRVQTVHYYITKPATEAIRDLGNFHTTSQWFTDTQDSFGRAPSVMSYDREENSIVTQDNRVWIAGLSDEGGAGAFVAAMMKLSAQPDEDEVTKLETFIHSVLWKTIQNRDFSVRKSIFFYQPDAVPEYKYDPNTDWTSWSSWNKTAAYSTDRAYDYVHITAAYWSLYRVGRAYPGLLKAESWEWYLNQAYQTVMRCVAVNENGDPVVSYSRVGLMGETVIGELLADLRRENRTSEAESLTAAMRSRATQWDSEPAPFGSEMAWDSTAQEGVYYWSKYFGYNDTAVKTLNTVLGYTPSISHWGWNGNTRRYWDNLYAGKLRRIERQIHHYGSGLNALVTLSAFRSNPTDSYLLRIGYGGMNGPLSNIDQDGFASASFHSFPETLAWDAYSGDYGPNHLGLILCSGTYVVQDKELGLVAYGGNIIEDQGNTITVQPRDAVRQRVYIGPLGVYVTIAAGIIQEFSYCPSSGVVSVTLSQLSWVPKAPSTVMWVETPYGDGEYRVITPGLKEERSGWQVPLGLAPTTVQIARS
ncbi:hypothetical protein VTN00DRAFT_6460 [Thermoascus crustaceus]|uniref:uncharacterized protein n=1 Tax=Thermoascus crustaceus TaxID=5088 RepID=UPI00374486AF